MWVKEPPPPPAAAIEKSIRSSSSTQQTMKMNGEQQQHKQQQLAGEFGLERHTKKLSSRPPLARPILQSINVRQRWRRWQRQTHTHTQTDRPPRRSQAIDDGRSKSTHRPRPFPPKILTSPSQLCC
ncbi:hypothetical protein niasHT_021628 [Heterodera trifolii]|uniref:Uncharacterized protein n=1 Tax=Heterodera trifolii TaxID=157864 RepID=A0ABD2JT87_9BILA